MLGARGIYYGGYPWRDLGILTAADLNAAISVAMQQPVTLSSEAVLAAIPSGGLSNSKLMYPYVTIGATNSPLGPSNITTLTGISTPVNPSDVATKYYVDNAAGLEGYTAGIGLDLIGNQFNIANTTVGPGTYGTASQVPQLTVNAQGQVTHAGNIAISIPASQLSNNVTGAGFVVLAQSPQLTGIVSISNRLVLTGSNSNIPAVAFQNTSQAPIWGLWNSGSFIIGTTDATGAAQTPLVQINNAGSIFANGDVNVGSSLRLPGGAWLTDHNGGWWLANNNSYYVFLLDPGTDPVFQWNSTGIGGLMNLDSSGNLFTHGGIAAGQSLTVSGAAVSVFASDIQFHSAKSTGIGIIYTNNNGAYYVALRWDPVNGMGFDVNGSWVGNVMPSTSDARLKSNIAPATVDALDVISRVRFHQFDLTPLGPDTKPQHWDIGFRSDELAELIPLSVARGDPDDPGRSHDTVNVFPLVVYAFAAIQQLAERVEVLETELRRQTQ